MAATNMIPERFLWALSVIAPAPGDCILEVGCGSGILVDMIAQELDKGRVIAIDKSASMITKACIRNKAHLEAGRVQLLTGDIADRHLLHASFNSIIAFNVNFFQKHDPRIRQLHDALKHKGALYVFQQDPGSRPRPTAEKIAAILPDNGFSVHKELLHPLNPAPVFGFIARKTQ